MVWHYGALLLAGIVFSPSIGSKYLLDDYLQASMVRGAFPAPRAPFDLYNFVDDASRTALLERGMLPWWADPRLTIRFFRPLSSLLVWGEHRLLGDGPFLLHLHSMIWWAAAVLGVRALFLRLLPARPAGIATFVFALAPCHALPLAWLANREALISLAFGAPAISAYLTWRDRGSWAHGLLATLLFALAMSGGEYALCLAGYVVALEAVREGGLLERGGITLGSLSRAFVGLLPFAVPAAAYLGVRRSLGYGTFGSGFYTDPFRDPLEFLRTAPRRLAVLLLDAWCALDHESMNSETADVVVVVAFVPAAIGVGLLVRRTIAHLSPELRRAARWFVLGSVLALLPVLAVVPSPRLGGAAMIGISAVVALVLDTFWWQGAGSDKSSRAAEVAATASLALGFAHLVHGPGTAWLVGRHFAGTARDFAIHADEMRASIDDPASAEVGVVRGMGGSFFAAFAVDPSRSPPERWRIFAQTGHVLALRKDARTLEVIAPAGRAIFPAGSENLYRNARTPIATDTTVEVQGMRVTILEMAPLGPRRVRYELPRDMDREPYVWITEDRRGAFKQATLPQEGFGAPFDP